MQFSDPNAGLYGDGPPYANVGLPYTRQWRGRSRGRSCLGCLFTLLVIVLLLAILSFALNVRLTGGPTLIQVSSRPTLLVESIANPHATIHIHAGGPGGQIAIQAGHPLNLPFGPLENYQESSDHQTVIYDLDPNTSGTFDITVPMQTNLKVDVNNATVIIEGITGKMTLETNNASLTVKNSHILGASLLRSNSGQIQALQDQLSGSVTLDNNSEGITFQGALDPAGSYSFTGNGGAIALALPQNTAAHIDASTNNGSISSNFPGVKAQQASAGLAIHADIGATPRAQLTLYNNGGSITINTQGGN